MTTSLVRRFQCDRCDRVEEVLPARSPALWVGICWTEPSEPLAVLDCPGKPQRLLLCNPCRREVIDFVHTRPTEEEAR